MPFQWESQAAKTAEARRPSMGRRSVAGMIRRDVAIMVCAAGILSGCTHPMTDQIELYMCADRQYAKLPRGPRRMDALWIKARDMTGSDDDALWLLGSLAVREGLRLKHPFSTGLTPKGELAPNDKSGHFFAHAMWSYFDRDRLVPVAPFNSVGWEIVGEIRSWFGKGKGFNWRDIWANRLGWEFARRLRAKRNGVGVDVLPSEIIAEAEAFRPDAVAPAARPDATPIARTAEKHSRRTSRHGVLNDGESPSRQ